MSEWDHGVWKCVFTVSQCADRGDIWLQRSRCVHDCVMSDWLHGVRKRVFDVPEWAGRNDV